MAYASAVSMDVDFGQTEASFETLNSSTPHKQKLMQITAASQQLVALRDSHEIVMVTLSRITELLGIRHAAIWSWKDDARKTLCCRSASTQRLYRAIQETEVSHRQGIVGWVTEHKRCGLFSGQDTEFLDCRARLNAFKFRAVLAIPLSIGGEVDSVLGIFSPEPQLLPEDIELANTLAKSAAIALENAQLVEALRQKTSELETRNEELDAFAHTVAHDLRTPLNWVNGYIELLIKDWELLTDDERVEYASATHHGAQMMSNIIDELLLLASLHDVDIVYSVVDMDLILQRAQNRLQPMLQQYNATLKIPQGYPPVQAYGPWVEGVWVNYISNAIKYGGAPPQVEVGYDDQGEMITFWVQDNGGGLTQEQQAELFTPFSGSGKKRGKGHGLGLSIVRRIVEKLGGEVHVHSVVDAGSRFSFTLPKA